MDYPCRFNNCQENATHVSIDNEEFYTKLSYVTSLYSYLQYSFNKSKFLLYRNLSFLKSKGSNRKELKECNAICESLLTDNIAKITNKLNSDSKISQNKDSIFSLIFIGFQDSFQECEWETVKATVDVFVVHQWRKSRKSQSGRKIVKLFEGLHVICNGKVLEGDNPKAERYSFKRSQLFQGTDDLRIFYSYILFKFRVLERRTSDSSMIDDDEKNNPKWGVFAVNYEAKFPFYKPSTDENNIQLHLLAGDYEMRLEVSMDQPSEPSNDEMDLEYTVDSLSDSSERLWVTEKMSHGTCVKEYNKWPRIIFKLESSHKTVQTHNFKAAFSNGFIENLPKKARAPQHDVIVSYKFFHKDQLLQWTSLRSLKCPWCNFNRERGSLNLSFDCLLRHLQTFHCRLSFKCNLKPADNTSSMVVAVSLNPCYDGSVEIGLRSWTGRRLIDTPERKLQFTHIIYCSLMAKISTKVKDVSIDMRPLLSGHNRHYICSSSGLAKTVKDMDWDSEEEDNPAWLRQMYEKRIEEFTDVNPGEKRVMQLWNSHLMDHKYNGDYMVPSLIRSFMVEKGAVMQAEDLRHNLLLHVVNLVEYGLLTQRQLVDVMDIFDREATSRNGTP